MASLAKCGSSQRTDLAEVSLGSYICQLNTIMRFVIQELNKGKHFVLLKI